jgi:hypothetical protein
VEGVDEGIAKRRAAQTGRAASTAQQRGETRPPPKAQLRGWCLRCYASPVRRLACASSLESEATTTSLLLPRTTTAFPFRSFATPSRSTGGEGAADAPEAVAGRAQAALLRRGRRRGGPVSHALSFFFFPRRGDPRVLSWVSGPEFGRPCLLSSWFFLIIPSNSTKR